LVPRFQRPYSWEKDQVYEFWQDTVIESDADYFIGSIVVYKRDGETFGIVDGQQRLTTVTIILCALRDYYKEEGFDKLANGIHVLVEKKDLNNDDQFILQTESSYPYFHEHIQKFGEPDLEVSLGSEEVNLKNSFLQIRTFIKNEIQKIKSDKQIKKTDLSVEIQNKLSEIRDKILRLKVIYIELDSEDDAYIIFETLNTRGKDLSVGDLVKNYLTKLIKAKNIGVDIPKDKWSSIRKNIESSAIDLDFDTFLVHVWLSKYAYTTTRALFKKIKNTIKAPQAKLFLDSLVNDSDIYKTIFDTQLRKWEKNDFPLKSSLDALYSFKVTQQTPMVLSIMREYNSKKLKYKYALEALTAIENFHYIFTAITSQRSSGGIASMYSIYAIKLANAKDDTEKLAVIRELKQKMKEKLQTYEEFLASFKTIKFLNDYTKQKRIIQYSLSKIDRHLNSGGNAIDYDKMTIEHIFPQNSKVAIIEDKDSVGKLGNLILVDEKTNGRLANKDFSDKKVELLKTSVYLDDYLKSESIWNSTQINKRTETLADIAYNKVFKL
jgi:uncharacterized protein with ParB-like and HNH nuclease domain